MKLTDTSSRPTVGAVNLPMVSNPVRTFTKPIVEQNTEGVNNDVSALAEVYRYILGPEWGQVKAGDHGE